jgi:hypothetical protein
MAPSQAPHLESRENGGNGESPGNNRCYFHVIGFHSLGWRSDEDLAWPTISQALLSKSAVFWIK